MTRKLIIFISRDKKDLNSMIYFARCKESDYALPGGYGIDETKDAVRQFISVNAPIIAKNGVVLPDIFQNDPTLEFIVEE